MEDVTPAGTNVRTLVHEYGGGAYAVFARPGGGVTCIYSEFADQRLYRLDLDEGAAGSRRRSPAADHPRASAAAQPALRRRDRRAPTGAR